MRRVVHHYETTKTMAVSYKVVSKRPAGVAGERAPRYYPAVTKRRLIDVRELADLMSERSVYNRSTVVGMIESMIELIPELLQDGYNIRLDGFGTFSIHVSGVGQDSPDKVTKRDITQVKMAFLPDKQIKQKLSRTEFVKVK